MIRGPPSFSRFIQLASHLSERASDIRAPLYIIHFVIVFVWGVTIWGRMDGSGPLGLASKREVH